MLCHDLRKALAVYVLTPLKGLAKLQVGLFTYKHKIHPYQVCFDTICKGLGKALAIFGLTP